MNNTEKYVLELRKEIDNLINKGLKGMSANDIKLVKELLYVYNELADRPFNDQHRQYQEQRDHMGYPIMYPMYEYGMREGQGQGRREREGQGGRQGQSTRPRQGRRPQNRAYGQYDQYDQYDQYGMYDDYEENEQKRRERDGNSPVFGGM